ncbi:hypothetical protein ACOBV9_22950 (plasmid) [Pseudoalteromonas espejiana]
MAACMLDGLLYGNGDAVMN